MNDVERLLAREPELAAKAAEADTQWRDHLARWAERELKRRGLHMDPSGRVRPAPFITRADGRMRTERHD
jgi:hypothetical protein